MGISKTFKQPKARTHTCPTRFIIREMPIETIWNITSFHLNDHYWKGKRALGEDRMDGKHFHTVCEKVIGANLENLMEFLQKKKK